jgi:hypothetical protein
LFDKVNQLLSHHLGLPGEITLNKQTTWYSNQIIESKLQKIKWGEQGGGGGGGGREGEQQQQQQQEQREEEQEEQGEEEKEEKEEDGGGEPTSLSYRPAMHLFVAYTSCFAGPEPFVLAMSYLIDQTMRRNTRRTYGTYKHSSKHNLYAIKKWRVLLV